MNQELDNKVKKRTSALEKANRRLEELSVTDGLTKLFNRRYFDQVFVTTTSNHTKTSTRSVS